MEYGLYKYTGIPIMPGKNLTLGNSYFVSKSGSDSNDGTTPKRAFASIEQATTVMKARISWSASPWAKHDKMYIYPGVYAENLTSLPYGCDMIGLGDAFDLDGQRGVTIKPSSGSAVDATSIINMRIENICFAAPDTSVIFQADNFNRNILKRCLFAGLPGASATTVKGLETVKDMTGNWIEDCQFLVCRNGIYVVTDNANSKQASGNMIKKVWITGGDQTGIYFHANSLPSYTQIDGAIINGGGETLALAIDDNSAVVHIQNSVFEATACDPASGAGHYNNCYLNGVLMT